MLTTSFLACTAPRLVAPAMNDRMYADAATQANLATLRERGVGVIEPDTGALASRGEHGTGRLPEPRAPARRGRGAAAGARAGRWDGLRVLVTAGGTREPIDPVRFIGNRSSGRMGLALAERAAAPRRRGRRWSRRTSRSRRRPAIETVARRDDRRARRRPSASAFGDAHVLLMAAAVADFRAGRRRGGQARARRRRPRAAPGGDRGHPRRARGRAGAPDQTLVGFAAEHGAEAVERAREKLERKARRRDRLQRRLAAGDRLRLDRQRGDDRRGARRAPRPARLQGGGRRGDPRPGRGDPRARRSAPAERRS